MWHRVFLSPAKPFLHNCLRFYGKINKYPAKMGGSTALVHQEILRYVNPYARINIESDLLVRIEPADVHQYTSGDVFIAQLRGDAVKNCNATLDVNVCDEGQVVNVQIKNQSNQSTTFKCDLKVPIRAELYINSSANVKVEGIQSEAIEIKSVGGILAKNLRATKIDLYSELGDIICKATLLAKCSEIKTNSGNIFLEKLQGDSLKCFTKCGNIETSCCYVEKSQFETESGRLDLKNVHKTSVVNVHNAGKLNMAGVHGNLSVFARGGSINLQLSELMGTSQIVTQDLESEAIINISDSIEQNTAINVIAQEINLDSALQHVAHALNTDQRQFVLKSDDSDANNILMINSTGQFGVRLGKQSWVDLMRQTITLTD